MPPGTATRQRDHSRTPTYLVDSRFWLDVFRSDLMIDYSQKLNCDVTYLISIDSYLISNLNEREREFDAKKIPLEVANKLFLKVIMSFFSRFFAFF